MKYSLIVVGGGIAGVAAAVSAKRLGMSVLLVEKSGSLGGAMTQALVYPYMRYTADNGKKLLSDGIFTEMRQRKEGYNETSWEAYRFVFDDMVSEAGVDVLFHTTVFKVNTEGRKILSIEATCKASTLKLEADYFIDCSGDGDLFALAGCDYLLGRESDGLSQPMTTCFRLGNVDVELFESTRKELQALYEQYQRENKITNPRENILAFFGIADGVVHFNTTRVIRLNPIDPFDLSKAEMLARKQIYEMVDFLKSNSPAFEKCYIASIASDIGVRESRKLRGEHILTAEELIAMTRFEDTVALGNYDIDIHNPDGKGTYIRSFNDSECYCIPYRSLLPKEYDNMLVAGRCISATHEAQAAIRIMPICACMGQASGTAAWLAYTASTALNAIDTEKLRKTLKANGAAV